MCDVSNGGGGGGGGRSPEKRPKDISLLQSRGLEY
jgi:hypothetical protein